ncbi:MAG: hypothetical protein JWO05_189 [Gemmatimonadetes bacterium]|nr:hypothetical protein [Gemmatimonadota bacterium]
MHTSRNHSTTRALRAGLAVAAALIATACADGTAPGSLAISNAALAASLSSTAAGFGSVNSSFVGSDAASAGNDLWIAGGRGAEFDHGGEHGGLMGGGLGDAFAGGIGRGDGFGHHGPFGSVRGGLNCSSGTFANGRVTCAPVTLPNGLVVNASAAYTNAAGTAQSAFDTVTTNTVNLQNSVAGTITFVAGSDSLGDHGHHGEPGWGHGRGEHGVLLGDTARILTATTVVSSSSDRTVSGLASGSTQRTVNGKSAGSESTTGTSSRGSFSATRTMGDTTSGLVIPVATTTTQTYPTAGSVIRAMSASLTYGSTTTTLTRREVITYDGTATAKVVITENGTVRSCTRPLPRGPLTCS